jgi:hypothetical protein
MNAGSMLHELSVAHRMKKLVRSMLVGSVEMRLFDTRLPHNHSAHRRVVTAGDRGLPLTREATQDTACCPKIRGEHEAC